LLPNLAEPRELFGRERVLDEEQRKFLAFLAKLYGIMGREL